MININDWMLNSLEIRQSHLNLLSDCIEIGGSSQEFRGLLAYFIKTTIPKGMKILLCHACDNSKCSNVEHLYWGTPSENIADAVACGAMDNLNLAKRTINKHGDDVYKKIIASGGKKGGLRNIRPKSEEHKAKISSSLMGHKFNGNRYTKAPKALR